MKMMVMLWLLAVGGAMGGELRVVSFNIRYAAGGDKGVRSWSARKDVVAEAVAAMRPDVMGVQEALAGQMDDLKPRLNGYVKEAWIDYFKNGDVWPSDHFPVGAVLDF